ncbi:MFS transporter [Nocardia paucivorans]|uniref:MFS transporter n=1 Tax=Nocardia paucivorans TaxID=114259 RepID=UPI0002DDD3B0|nr:MFS transporter [Nocardia paucivorans]
MTGDIAAARWDPVMRRILGGYLVSQLGTAVSRIALMAQLVQMSGSPHDWAYLAAVQAIPYATFGLMVGYITDRFDRRRVLIACDMARCLIFVLIPFAQSLPQLFALAFAAGTFNAVYAPTYRALTAELVDARRLLTVNALEQTGNGVIMAIGIGLSGLLIASVPIAVCFYIDAATYGICAVVLATLPATKAARERAASTGLRRELLAGIVAVRATPAVRYPMLVSATLTVLVAFQGPMFFPLVDERKWGGAAEVGYMTAIAAAGAVVTGIALARRERAPLSSRYALGAVLVCDAVAVLVLGGTGWYALAASLCLLLGVTETLLTTFATTEIQRQAPPEACGRIFAALGIVAEPARVVAMLASGLVVGALGALPGFALSAAAEGLLGIATILLVIRTARRPAPIPVSAIPEENP